MRIHFFTAPFFRRQSLYFTYDGEEGRGGCRKRCLFLLLTTQKNMLLSEHAFYFANIIHPFR